MARRVLLCLSHCVEEADQLDLLSSIGFECASIGSYVDPAHPHDPKRPPLPNVPCVQVVKDAVDGLGTDDNLGAAQRWIPDAVLEWLGADGVIIYHHLLDRLFSQWGHLAEWRAAGGRVIWRTVGQSVEQNERMAAPFRADGLEVVRYSPRERNIPGYVGEDALIRFWKDPALWTGWVGDLPHVTNVTQDLVGRHPWTNAAFWAEATEGLLTAPAGPNSEALPGGVGQLSLDGMIKLLQHAGTYLYTGTQPASYTLGLIEALMVGVPVVSISRSYMNIFPYGPDLFEGQDLSPLSARDPVMAKSVLVELLRNRSWAEDISKLQRERAVRTFGREPVAAAWLEYLGAP